MNLGFAFPTLIRFPSPSTWGRPFCRLPFHKGYACSLITAECFPHKYPLKEPPPPASLHNWKRILSTINKDRQFFMQPDYFIFIGRIVQRRISIQNLYRQPPAMREALTSQRVLNISCIDITTISYFVSRLGGGGLKLVTGIRLIIRPAKTGYGRSGNAGLPIWLHRSCHFWASPFIFSNGAESAYSISPPAPTCETGFVIYKRYVVPTLLHTASALAKEINSGTGTSFSHPGFFY